MFFDPNLLKRCLFIDIETVSEYNSYESLQDDKKILWQKKCQQWLKQDTEDMDVQYATLYVEKSGIFSEFAKVVCVSLGFLSFENGVPTKIRLKSIAGDDECTILKSFAEILSNHYQDLETSKLCGHNIKEFDVPFLCRRMVIHQIKLPEILDISGKKPWQTTHLLDTLEMWRFGDYKNYTSLNLLSNTLSIPSPKDDIDGSMVGPIYWNEGDLDRIAIYCQKDVITVIQVMMKFSGLPLFVENQIEYIQSK